MSKPLFISVDYWDLTVTSMFMLYQLLMSITIL